MDFDQLVPGHGPIGTKADVRAFREYMEELHAEVVRGGYKDMFALNVAGMYRHVQMHRRPN